MKRISLLFLIALPIAGQVTGVSPTSVTLDMVQSGVAAPGYKINVLGSGGYTATIDGATNCFHFRYGALTGTAGTDGIWFFNYQTSTTQAPGAYSCNIVLDFAGTDYTVTVNYTIHRRWMWEYFTNGLKVADSALGCTKATAEHPGYGQCAVPQYAPAGGWTPPAKGATFTSFFGYPVRRLAIASSPSYGSNSHINLDNSLITTFSGVAEDGVWTIADLTRRGSHTMAGGGWWSLVDRRDKYFVNGTKVQRIRCNDANCTSTTTSDVYTHTENIYQGGNSDMASGDTIAFWTNDDVEDERKDVCVLEVHSGLPAVCASLDDGFPYGRPNDPSPTQGTVVNPTPPDGDGYRYIVAGFHYIPDAAHLRIYSYKNRTLTLLTPNGLPKPYQPQANGTTGTWSSNPALNPSVMGGGHSDVVLAGGRVFWLPTDAARTDPSFGIGTSFIDLTQIRKGYDSKFALELGGYMQIGVSTQTSSDYTSCAQLAPVCKVSGMSTVSRQFDGYGISAISHNGAEATITTALYGSPSSHGLSVGDTVLINNVEGIVSGLPNGTYTTKSGTTGSTVVVDCNLGACSGTFAVGNGAASLVKNQAQTWQTVAGEEEIQTNRWWQYGPFHLRRLAKHRAVQYNGCRGPYTDQYTHAGMSPDGTMVFYKDNHGIPCAGGAHLVGTGWNLALDTPSRHFSRNGDGMEIARSATRLALRMAGPGNCVVQHSTNRDLASATTTNLTGREAVTLTVSASSRYYLRAVCDEDMVAVDEIDTPAAPTGSATLRISAVAPTGTATMRVNYGAASTSESNASASCSAGQECTVPISATRGGAIHSQIVWLDGGGATIATEPAVIDAVL